MRDILLYQQALKFMAEETGIINQNYGMKSTMGTTSLKPTQKLVNFNKTKLLIHPQAESALSIWQRLRFITSSINIEYLDSFYCPPIRLTKNSCNTLFFINDFKRIDEILRLQSTDSYLCLITPESINDIQMLAWAEVVKLVFTKDIHHPQLFKALKQKAPKSIICKLMGIDSLTIDNYCFFAGIAKTNFEYQQTKISIEDGLVGLPLSMNWLGN